MSQRKNISGLNAHYQNRKSEPMSIIILDGFTVDQGADLEQAWPGLSSLGSITRYDRTLPHQLPEHLCGAEVILTNKVSLNKDIFSSYNTIKYVGVMATGYNIIDTNAAQKHGVAVTNVPDYSSHSVTQTTLALLLECCCSIADHNRRVHQGDWSSCPDFTFLHRPITECHKKTIVIIGAGHIGRTVGNVALAMGMKVIYAQIPGRPVDSNKMDLKQAIVQADFISLHCPSTPLTRYMVNHEFLTLCKPNLKLINTARGDLIDENVLADWLHQNTEARCGLDVLATEPPLENHPLLKHPQVIITPHLAWASDESRERLRTMIIHNLTAWLKGEPFNRID